MVKRSVKPKRKLVSRRKKPAPFVLAPKTLQIFSSKMNRARTFGERVADFFARFFGSVQFFLMNFFIFSTWLLINMNMIPGITAFDPYPFGMLTTLLSLEAIFLSMIVLMSQNRAGRMADLREEIDFQINVESEREATKILNMLDAIQHSLKIPHKDDDELKLMERNIDVDELENEIEAELNRTR